MAPVVNDVELSFFLKDMKNSAKGIGQKGGRYFTVTYSFVGSVIYLPLQNSVGMKLT